MSRQKSNDDNQDNHDNIAKLDRLINKYYNLLDKHEFKYPKIGDFIKMIEARKKLAPTDTDQKEFWSMLDEIRKKKLGKKKPAVKGKRKTAKE